MSRTGNQATRQQGNEAKCAVGLRRVRGTAFTLVELLVVIVVIGVLAGVILTISTRVLGQQKVNTTKNTMRLVGLAIDQFTAEDPLKPVYNSRNNRTFGSYPPYQLANWYAQGGPSEVGPNNVSAALEPSWPGGLNYTLTNRLWRDLGNGELSDANWVSPSLKAQSQLPEQIRHNDIRSLYAYLAAYSPGVLEQIPESAIKRDDRLAPEFINPTGTGPPPGADGSTWIDVFGFYDAWDVPLDYLLYVKVEYGVMPSGTTGWMVTDRVAVLRSRGITAEEAVHGVVEPQRALYSVLLPQPAANVNPDNGAFLSPSRNGWSRAVAEGDDYKYVPEQ